MWGIISIIFGAIELIIGLRFFFLLLGVNPSASFVSWIYSLSGPLVAPFTGIFGAATTASSGAVVHSVFEPAAIVALVVYAAVGGILLRLLATPSRG